jgi:hypothetical protein
MDDYFPSINNRDALLKSTMCGCHLCRKLFSSSEIAEWTDENEHGIGQTALCPRCGLDGVLGDAQSELNAPAFLASLRRAFGK